MAAHASHVELTYQEAPPGATWCGTPPAPGEAVFFNAAHAANAVLSGRRESVCPRCLAAVRAALDGLPFWGLSACEREPDGADGAPASVEVRRDAGRVRVTSRVESRELTVYLGPALARDVAGWLSACADEAGG